MILAAHPVRRDQLAHPAVARLTRQDGDWVLTGLAKPASATLVPAA